MRDHFSILHKGDVTLCCVDFDRKAAVGNLRHSSLKEILSSDEVEKIVKGFRRLKLVHPYCRHCLGSRSFASLLFNPVPSITVLKALKPFFYMRTKLYR